MQRHHEDNLYRNLADDICYSTESEKVGNMHEKKSKTSQQCFIPEIITYSKFIADIFSNFKL